MITKENAKDYAHLFQALLEGQTLQIKSSNPNIARTWVDLDEVRFTEPAYSYRIKETKRNINYWVFFDFNSGFLRSFYIKEDAESTHKQLKNVSQIVELDLHEE